MPAMLTRRKDQVTFKPGMPAGETLIGGVLFCGSEEGRMNWVRILSQKHPSKFNNFVFFKDVQSDYALQFGFAEWSYGVRILR
jgi:hypothetical protein